MAENPAKTSGRVPWEVARAARRQRAARLSAARKERWAFRLRRLRRAFLALAVMTLGVIGAAIFMDGLADGTLVLAILAGLVVFCLLAVFPSAPRIRVSDLGEASLPELAGNAGAWLESRRRALPAPARDAIDMVGVRLDQLSPQLATLDANGPAALEARKLLCEHLPGLVESYTRIPAALRGKPGASGATPSQQLVEGLYVISGEIEAMSHDLSRGDIDALATRNRYLESRYVEPEVKL
jgi:hypothetical protein